MGIHPDHGLFHRGRVYLRCRNGLVPQLCGIPHFPGESFIKGRSRCPSCGHELSFLDLFPIFSWLFLRGKCRYCKAKVSPRYFITEIAFAILTAGTLLRFDLTFLCLRNYIFICCLFVLSLVDVEIFEIPNGTLIIPAVAWFAAWGASIPTTEDWLHELWTHVASGVGMGVAVLLISLILDKILKKDSLGGGDIKLLAVVGLYLGAFGSIFALIVSCVLGLLLGVIMKKRKDEEGHFPFGPAIAVSACIMLFVGDALVEWYLGILGI